MPKLRGSVCVYGTGVLGCAIAEALLDCGLVGRSAIWGVSKTEATARQVKSKLGFPVKTENFGKELKRSAIVILAVKPSQTRGAIKELRNLGLSKRTLVLSIVTGVKLAVLEEGLGAGVPVVRIVTNTPCLVRQGVSGLCGGTSAKTAHLKTARAIFEQLGMCIDVEEHLCEAVTGLSASGPAYIYLILEALADGGVRVGLPRDTAFKVIAQTMLGASTMVLKTGRHPASLRDDVTTPAGCTIGALLVMEDGRLRSTLARAVEEATRIAKELGKG